MRRTDSWYCLQAIWKEIRKIIFCRIRNWIRRYKHCFSTRVSTLGRSSSSIDKDVLEVAQKLKNHRGNKFQILLRKLVDPSWKLKGKLDLAIANPPYVPKDAYEKASWKFWQKLLLGGEDGLKHIREIIQKHHYF